MSNSGSNRGGLGGRLRKMTDTNLLMSITIIVFIVMYLGAIIFLQKGFLKPQTLFNIMNANAALIIMSCGMTLVMITGGIDISVGGVAALVSMSCAVYLDYHGGNIIGAILISLAIGLAFGLVQGYLVAYLIMYLLGLLAPGMRSVIFGFNFLIGVLSAALIKLILNALKKKNVIKKEYVNNFLMTRVSNFFFDIMVVAGIAAIRLHVLKNYWVVILIIGAVGLVITFIYNHFVAKKLFPDYAEEQFLMMYGMLTGTASTGIILLREIDGEFKTPASDNMVYQNFPAIVFGFPIMLLAT
ncbi:MAG: hypothetical protein J6S92_14810, partial [Oscillospiraceae bacterium]|nr:hypothetical protein [Oscillospiraceae bacterium]